MLKYNYHTTFEIINLNCYYALTDKQVKEIIDKLTTTFPNLEEIILNFNGCSMIDFDDFINYILLNYLKFCKFSNLSIKIQFDFKIRFYNIPYADINFSFYQPNFNFNLCILSEMVKQNIIISKNIYIVVNTGHNVYADLKYIYELFNKFKSTINFIIILDMYTTPFDIIENKYKNIDGFYFTYYYKATNYFNTIEGDFCYQNNQELLKKYRKLHRTVYNFPLYYKYMTDKNITKDCEKIYLDEKLKKIIRNHDEYFITGCRIFKRVKLSDDFEMYMTSNGTYRIYSNNLNAIKWHNFQHNILEYFNVNDRYEL